MSVAVECLGDWVDVCPWRSARVLLVGVVDGVPVQGWTLTDKRALLRLAVEPLLVVWPGKWSSSSRVVAVSEFAAVLEKIS